MWGSYEKIIAVLFLLLFSGNGHTISVKLRYDKRDIIRLANFQFSDHVGHVSFLISSVTVTASQPADPSRVGFILEPRQVRNRTRFKLMEENTNSTICALDFKVLFTLQNLSHSSHKSFPVTNSGMKSLFFVNCNNESFVTMDGRAELYNVDDDTKNNNYLSAGLTELPFLSFIFSLLYLCLLGFWMLVCFSNKRAFSRAHLLMGGLLLINSVYFICVAADLLYVMANGTAHHGLDALFSVLHLTRSLFLFTMIVLIGVGWFLWKPYLYPQEMAALTVVILLQLLANVDPVLPWEPDVPAAAYDLQSIFSMVDIICCFFIILPITVSVLWLQMVCQTIPSAYRNLEKLSFFNMHLAVYMVITRLIVPILPTQSLMYAVKETTTLLFHIMMLYVFRPVDHRIHTAGESWLPTLLSISCFDSPV